MGSRPWSAPREAQVHVHRRTQEACRRLSVSRNLILTQVDFSQVHLPQVVLAQVYLTQEACLFLSVS